MAMQRAGAVVLALVVAAGVAQATVLVNEDFSGTSLPAGWTLMENAAGSSVYNEFVKESSGMREVS